MQKLFSLLAALLTISCFVLSNYAAYEFLTMPYRAGGYPIPTHFGMNSNLDISLFGGVLAGGFCCFLFVGVARLLSRFAKDKKTVSRYLFWVFSVSLACWTLSKKENRTVLVTTSSERMENFKKSGVMEALESKGFFTKEDK